MLLVIGIPAKLWSGFLSVGGIAVNAHTYRLCSCTKQILLNNKYRFINTDMDLSDMRISYDKEPFTEKNLVAKEPITQFQDWFDTACRTPAIAEANAMCLATATRNGRPSVRMVLLKGFSKEGFIFHTNYDSRKGKELAENPFAALTFYWEPLRRQIRLEGSVTKLPSKDSVAYFNSRPRESQLGAKASNQSEVIPGRQVLIDKFSALRQQYEDESVQIPKPENWGGFLLVPEVIEFWQGQTNRLHDRIRFRRPVDSEVVDDKLTHVGSDGWLYERLSP